MGSSTPAAAARQSSGALSGLRRMLVMFVAQENVLLGGQAVLEGVMMRSPKAYAVAVRRPDGGIEYLAETAPAWTTRHRLLRLPVVRGVCTLFQSLSIGLKALNFSTEHAFPEEQRAGKEQKKTTQLGMWLSMAMALALGIGLFFLLPLGLTELIHRYWPALGKGFGYNLVDGLIRGVIFLAYVWAIGLAPDIKRLFRYHGAEHKVVHAFEAKGGMDVETVQKFTTLHPRCGTSFLLFVMVISILVFSFIPAGVPAWGKALARIVLLPLVAGLSYEIIRFSGRHRGAVIDALVAPGLLLQKLTTAPPDDEMVGVALAAFHRAAELEGGREAIVL